jgi:hypothetical protein
MVAGTRELLAGSLAGFAATAPMTAVMDALHRQVPPEDQRPLPPREITEQAVEAVGAEDELPEDAKTGLTMLAHFGYGAAAGGVYGVVAPHLPFTPAVNGIAYGLAVWAGSYLGWLPALGIQPPQTEEPAGRVGVMVAAHVAWGATLGVLTDLMLRRGRDRTWSEDRSGRPMMLASGS